MSFDYIRKTYGVPAKRGGHVMIKLYDDIPVNSEVEAFRTGLVDLTTLADDYRVELLDQEDKAEEEFNARHAADDLGDAKLEERRDER